MNLSHADWNEQLAIENYDQGWAMVQFLAHAENHKYQEPFSGFMADVSAGKPWQAAWDARFHGTEGFEKAWRDYWTNLPDNPTIELYAQANLATWTSLFARAWSQQQKFDSFEAFRTAAANGELKSHPDDWLPPSLLTIAMQDTDVLAKHGYSYVIFTKAGERTPQLVCTMPDGSQVIGRFMTRNGRVVWVKTDVVRKKK